jgi:antibiotic biosynthesis monooxygenase (ABM) superfamily enzyme
MKGKKNAGDKGKEVAMVKGIIGFKVLSYKDVEPILAKLRSHAMQYPGHVGAENLVSEEDYSIVLMISTWEKIENWRTWAESRRTRELLKQAKEVAVGSARLTAYRTLPTVEWR